MTQSFTPEEKLRLIAEELMDPKELGMVSAEEAKLQILDQAPPERKLGDFIQFEASVVPIDVRAKFAYDEEKIIPPNKDLWIEEWKLKHRDEVVVQGRVRSGNATAILGGKLVKDQTLGLINLLDDAARLLRAEYDRERT